MPQIKAGIGAGDAAFGGALFAASVMLFAAMLAAPRLEARLGLLALPLGTLAMCAAFLLPGLAGSVAGLAVAMGCAALTSGSLDVIMNARIAGLEEKTGRPLMNLNHAMFSFSYMISALLAGAGREAEWSAFAIFVCIIGVALLALPLTVMRATPAPLDEPAVAAPLGPMGGVVIWGGLIVFAGFTGEHAAEAWSALHLERTLGGGAAQGALGPALLGGTMFLGRMSGQLLSARMSARIVLTGGAALGACGAWVAASAPTLGAAYAGFALLGLGVSVLAPTALGMVGRRVSHSIRIKVIAQVSMIGFLGFFVGPPLMGGLSALFGLRWSFAAIGFLMVLVPLALIPLLRQAPERPAPASSQASRSQSRP